VAALHHHPAFGHRPDQARDALRPLEQLLCPNDGALTGDNLRCAGCQRLVGNLSPAVLTGVRRSVEAALDALLPQEPKECLAPLSLQRRLTREEDLEGVVAEVRRYLRRASGPVEVRLEARVVGEE